MSPTHRHGPAGVDLSREEAWVLHAAVLDYAEREVDARRSPDRALALLDRIEAAEPLDADQCDVARDALRTHLDDAPPRDRGPARSALRSVDSRSSAA